MKKLRNFAQPSLYDGRFPLEEMIDLEDQFCILADHIIELDAVARFYDKNFEDCIFREESTICTEKQHHPHGP